MEQWEVGWAGPFGPHFFIYLGSKEQNSHWGKSHTWGVVDGKESRAVINRILGLPATHIITKSGKMNQLDDRVTINIERDAPTEAIGGVVLEATS